MASAFQGFPAIGRVSGSFLGVLINALQQHSLLQRLFHAKIPALSVFVREQRGVIILSAVYFACGLRLVIHPSSALANLRQQFVSSRRYCDVLYGQIHFGYIFGRAATEQHFVDRH